MEINFDWEQRRDDTTCEVVHYLTNGKNDVATVRKDGYRFKAQFLDHYPFNTNSLKTAKSTLNYIFSQYIYSQHNS